MSEQVAAPLAKLQGVMQRIGDGDYDQKSDHSGVSELDLVSDRLVEMGQTLGAAHRQILEQQDAVARAFAIEKQITHGQRRFINLLSHELRTPLTLIDSCGQILRRQAHRLTPEDLSARSGTIRSAADRITAIIDSAVSMLRLEEDGVRLNPARVQIRDILSQSMNALDAVADRIVTDMDDPDAYLRVDGKLIASALAALLDNAVKFSAPSATIAVEIRCVGGDCHIRVVDQGMGICADDLPAVTERFYRGRNSMSISGAGVGLFMARNWVVAHGGELKISSRSGEGTTAEIWLKNVLDDTQERAVA